MSPDWRSPRARTEAATGVSRVQSRGRRASRSPAAAVWGVRHPIAHEPLFIVRSRATVCSWVSGRRVPVAAADGDRHLRTLARVRLSGRFTIVLLVAALARRRERIPLPGAAARDRARRVVVWATARGRGRSIRRTPPTNCARGAVQPDDDGGVLRRRLQRHRVARAGDGAVHRASRRSSGSRCASLHS